MTIVSARGRRRLTHLAIWALVLVCPGLAAAQSTLARARAQYNEGLLDEAIATATIASSRPSLAPSATLIVARARLERFRRDGDRQDLEAARKALVSLNPRGLAPQEAIEWQVGVGAVLFLDDQLGPAAEVFTSVLPAARERLPQAELEKLLEWWGGTMSRLAETFTGDARAQAYERFQADVRLELGRNPLSRPAMYWMVLALRGTGALDAAWGAALAAWIRAGGQPEGRKLREDLERFVTQTLIPERAQARTGQRLDSKPAVADTATLIEEWRAMTGAWAGE